MFFMKYSILVALIISFSQTFAISEFVIKPSISNGYSDNPYIFENKLNSLITELNLKFNYTPDNSNFKLKSEFEKVFFLNYQNGNYIKSNIEANYSFQPFDYPYFDCSSGLKFFIRENDVQNSHLNNLMVSPYLDLILYSDIGVLRIGYNPYLRIFKDFVNLNSFNHSIYFEVEKVFPSETGVFLSLNFRNTEYYSINQLNIIKRFENNNFMMPQIIVNHQNVNQFIYSNLSLSQSVDENKHFGVSFGLTKHLSNHGVYYTSGNTDLIDENNLFVDNNNFDEMSFGTFFKLKMDRNFEFEIDVSNFNRDFQFSEKLVDSVYNGNIKRKDYGYIFGVNLCYKSKFPTKSIDFVNIDFGLDFISNYSSTKNYSFETYYLKLLGSIGI